MLANIVRTVVPLLVGVIVGQAARIGLDLDPGAVTSIVTVLVGGAYYAGLRWLEQHWPAAGWLLGRAQTTQKPRLP